MPYIPKNQRENLDSAIENLMNSVVETVDGNSKSGLSAENFAKAAGCLNYAISRILSGVAGQVSYSKINTIVGVLDCIKMEFYERVAKNYEQDKKEENGDIIEYAKLENNLF